MIRSAAKNHDGVTVVVDPDDYPAVLDEMAANQGATTLALRRRLAAKAFARTAAYDAAVSNWFARQLKDDAPDFRAFGGRAEPVAALWREPASAGRVLSYARQAPRRRHRASSFRARNCPTTTSTIPMRPMNASANSIRSAPRPASSSSTPIPAASPKVPIWSAPIARRSPAIRSRAFGGIIAFNRKLDGEAARDITKIFTEVIIAPDATKKPSRSSRRKNLRLLLAGGLPDPRAAGLTAKSVAGGFLVQSRDNAVVDDLTLKTVTKRAPTDAELRDLLFAFRVAKHVKSNAIVYAKDGATVGIGAGQMSRVDAARIAARKAQDAAWRQLAEPLTKGSVVASDAFFPFADGLLACVEAGATAVIQPGGSIRDDDVIKAADEHGLAMVFTGVRHFRH